MGNANIRFFAQMGTASALSLVRGFLLAQLLTPNAFGMYAVLFALGTFSSSLLGLGEIERTNKRFPRLIVDGHGQQALGQADGIARLLAVRALVAAAALALVTPFVTSWDWTTGLVAATAIALGAGLQAIFMSIHRAVGELPTLGRATLARTVLALLFAVAGGYLASWQGALAGEFLGALTGAAISRAYARRVSASVEPPKSAPAAIDENSWLFLAFLVGSVPIYLDRFTVSLLYGADTAGTYGLLMLFVTAAVTLSTIVVQKVGPQLVRLERAGTPLRRQLGLAVAWCAALSGASFLGMVCAAALLAGPFASLAAKYSLTAPLIGATTLLCCLQVSMVLDWVLLSQDRERQVFQAAAAYVATLALGIGTLWVLEAALVWFLWVMALAKLLHVAMLLLYILLRARPPDLTETVQA